jgi:lipopolysaccharide transport system permease protein
VSSAAIVDSGSDRARFRAAGGRSDPAIAWAGLAWTLIRTDFKTRYHGSAGGFVWALLKPICMFVVLMFVFSLLFSSDPAYKLNLIVGLFLWDFFTEGTKAGLTSLAAKSFLLAKARFPAWIVVVTSIANAAITLGVFLIVIILFLAAAGHAPTFAGVARFLLYCGSLAAIVTGFSLATSVLFLRYRDLNQVWDVIMQAGFFVAPVVYPIGIIPERFHFFLYLWPPTPVIEFSRAVLIRGVSPSATGHLYLALEAVLVLAVGCLVFRRFAPRAAEYV